MISADILRKKVLDKAIRGELVDNNPNEKAVDVKEIKDNVPFVIPSNWKWVRFSSILKVTSGNFLSKSEKKNIGEYPIYGGNGITGYYKDYNVSEKTIIIGRVGYYCGNIHLTSQKAWITDNALIASFLISEYNVEYMFYILNYIGLRENKNSTAQPVISANKIKNILIPLPPLEEQKRIVAKIEELFKLMDIKEKNDIKLNSYKEKLKGKVLNEAIRGKLVEQDSNEQPIDIEDIKDNVPFVIPSNWKWVRFSSILKVTSGNFLSKSEKKNIGEYPIYGGNGITGYYKDYNVSEKTIIIGRVGYYCGNIHLTSQKAWITDNALIASFLISEYNVEYMFYILNYIGLRENKNSTAQPVISANKIKNILIPLPPLREQKRIVSKIEQLFNFIDKLEC
jgi:type I restriction enzyme S subunit